MGGEDVVVKVTGTNGEAVYRLREGGKINTYRESSIEIAIQGLKNLDAFFDLLVKGGDMDVVRRIGKALVENCKHKLEQSQAFVLQNFGDLEIERAEYGQRGIEGGKMLGVVFTPAQTEGVEPENPTDYMKLLG